MKAYHPIERIEQINWHEIFTDGRFWAGVTVVAFVLLFTALVIISAKNGGTSQTMPYYWGWPYGAPYMPPAAPPPAP